MNRHLESIRKAVGRLDMITDRTLRDRDIDGRLAAVAVEIWALLDDASLRDDQMPAAPPQEGGGK